VSSDLTWLLLYTKRHAERWAELNLQHQGFSTLLPKVRERRGIAPLFPRYLFVAHVETARTSVIKNTFGVLYVVQCGTKPALVPAELIAELHARMDVRGVVELDHGPSPDPLYAARQRERLHALQKFADAGFRVRAA
jgi:transcription antitermination factor NusG